MTSLNRGASHVSSFLGFGINHSETKFSSNEVSSGFYIPEQPHAGPPIMYGYTDITPDGAQADLGSAAETFYKWQINNSQAIDRCYWIAQFSALSAGAGGNNQRYIDNLGPMALLRSRMYFNSKIVEEIPGERYFFCSQRELDPFEYTERAAFERRDIAKADRITAATAVQEVGCHLDWWFTLHQRNSWQQYMHAADSSIRFSVVTRDSAQLLKQDVANTKPTPNGSPNYLVESMLRFRVWALPAAMRDYIKGRVMRGGHSYYSAHQEYFTQNIAAADTSVELDLRGAIGHTIYSISTIRKDIDIDGTDYVNGNNRASVQPWTSRKFRANGLDFYPEHTYRFSEHVVNGQHFPATTGRNSCLVVHAPHPYIKTVADGGVDYHSLTDKKLTINFAAIGAASTIDYYSIVRQRILFQPEREGAATFSIKAAWFF